MNKPLAVVCGAGPGLGLTVARTLADGGHQVVALNRSVTAEQYDNIEFRRQDCADSATTQTQLADIMQVYGTPSVYIHNPPQLLIKPFAECSAIDFEAAWRSMSLRSREMHSLSPDKMMTPEAIADAYMNLIAQHPSTWTHELDLRPMSESF